MFRKSTKKPAERLQRLIDLGKQADGNEKQLTVVLYEYAVTLEGILVDISKNRGKFDEFEHPEDLDPSAASAPGASSGDNKDKGRQGTPVLRPFSTKEQPLEDLLVSQEVLDLLVKCLPPKCPDSVRLAANCVADNTYFLLSKANVAYENKLAVLVPAICEGLVEADSVLATSLGTMWNLTNSKEVSRVICSGGYLGKFITLLNSLEDFKLKVKVISAIANISGTEECRKILIQERAVDWLIPTTFSKNVELKMKAGIIIGNIACSKSEGAVDYVKGTGALDRLIDFALTCDPRLQGSSGTWMAGDVAQFVDMCNNVALTPVQIFGAHMLVQVIFQVQSRKDKFQLLIIGETETKCLARLATSPNPAVRALAIQGLCAMTTKLPMEVLNPDGLAVTASTVEPPPSYASLEVSSSSTAAAGAAAGASGSGASSATVVALTEENARLRKVLADIQSMLNLSIPAVTVPKPVAEKPSEHCDIFISYRRSTGSQLASLLKVHLSLRGYKVFLDVDLLGKGTFDDALLENVENATNFISLLTEGSLDRCITDMGNTDWVRKEISLAIRKKKNLVPVFLSGFKFPEARELPEDIRDLLRHNSVEWIHSYQNACVDKICSFLVKQS